MPINDVSAGLDNNLHNKKMKNNLEIKLLKEGRNGVFNSLIWVSMNNNIVYFRLPRSFS